MKMKRNPHLKENISFREDTFGKTSRAGAA
jgi:hypothetical protein